jgi:Type I restriction enzyme R protein N terminus (HSDR_N)
LGQIDFYLPLICNQVYELNLPAFACRLREGADGLAIYDVCRGKYVALTPEEWVRQHFVHYLLGQGCPRALMRIEGGHRYNRLARRTDILVFDRAQQPWLLVECKAPTIGLGPSVLEQALAYNHVLRAAHVAVTNGVEHAYFVRDEQQGLHLPLEALPSFG